jgi:hypothetical protein
VSLFLGNRRRYCIGSTFGGVNPDPDSGDEEVSEEKVSMVSPIVFSPYPPSTCLLSTCGKTV